MKRPILSVGWNLSDFSPPCFIPFWGLSHVTLPPRCHLSLVFPCSGAHAASASSVSLAWLLREVSHVWRSRLALVLDVKVRAGGKKKKKKGPPSSLIHPPVRTVPGHPPLPHSPTRSSSRRSSRSAVIQL